MIIVYDTKTNEINIIHTDILPECGQEMLNIIVNKLVSNGTNSRFQLKSEGKGPNGSLWCVIESNGRNYQNYTMFAHIASD